MGKVMSRASVVRSATGNFKLKLGRGRTLDLLDADKKTVGQALAAQGATRMVPYMGLVSNKCNAPTTKAGSTNAQLNARSRHVAMAAIYDPTVYFANWYTPSNSGETLPGAAAQYTCAIEYPVGTFTQLTKGGSATLNIADGGTDCFDPAVGLYIPPGATFFVRVWQNSPQGIIYTTSGSNTVINAVPDTGETCDYGLTITDNTMTGVNPNNKASGVVCRPVAIVAMTTRPTFFQLADSRGANAGLSDSVDDVAGLLGEMNRSIGRRYGTINCGTSGESLTSAVTNYTGGRRLALAAFCSHVISNVGINDVASGRTLVQMAADLQTLITLFGKPWIHCTVSPYSTSTDGFGTVANQTTIANNSVRVAFNAKVRSGAYGIDGYCEVADQVESARDVGKWKPAERSVTDAAITSGTATLNSATAAFTAGDQDKHVSVPGAGAAGAVLITKISAVVSATQVTLAANAGTTIASGGTAHIGLSTQDGLHGARTGYQLIQNSRALSIPMLESL